jgi:hypothetical protein
MTTVVQIAEGLGIKRRLTPEGTDEMFGTVTMINRLYWVGFHAGQHAREDEEDAKRAADQAHRERIHAEIANDLDDIDKTGPLSIFGIVDAIAAGRIRHLSINYED